MNGDALKIQELVEIMRKSRPNASPADLHLATSVFECTGCLDATNPRSNAVRMIYPQMFYHSCCLWHRQPVKSRSDERIKAYRPRLSSSFTAGPWSSQSITWSEIGSQNAKKIVETCSLDPATTTIKDLDFANPLIECCEQHSVRIFMRWPFALNHHDNHPLRTVDPFGEESKLILTSEPDGNTWDNDAICCVHCHKTLARTFDALLDHLNDAHSDISIDVDRLETSKAGALRVQAHWYWNPQHELRSLCDEFRY
ncbi:hypothetical protein BT96DRAFT_999276 [Gymnopus androsaceus JB14]|uniref:Uncharacterized protein n=1 Tax=Gymnopus androsaceus JB14 TaxID=1447944 RepID=A0A6A4H8L0_9AGAR|nr:hypothetical protein BT96DRAFT_999276 [Gymnopus androsaceus JB14]